MRKAVLIASITLNILLGAYLIYMHSGKQSAAPQPYGRFYLGRNFSENWNDGKTLKEFLLANDGGIVALSFWIDTDDVDVTLEDNRFSFSASTSMTDPNDYSGRNSTTVATTELPNRMQFLNIYREGKYLSITGLFTVSDVKPGRQGISHIVMLTPEK